MMPKTTIRVFYTNKMKKLTENQKLKVKKFIKNLKEMSGESVTSLLKEEQQIKRESEIEKLAQLINSKFNNEFQAQFDIKLNPPVYGGQKQCLSIRSNNTKVPTKLQDFLLDQKIRLVVITSSKRVGGYKLKCIVWKNVK